MYIQEIEHKMFMIDCIPKENVISSYINGNNQNIEFKNLL